MVLDRLTSAFAALRRLGCTPAEAVAVAVIATASVVLVGLLWWSGRALPPVPTGMTPSEMASDGVAAGVSAVDVIVHVAGAVKAPGVYTLPGGSRVGDAVQAAGGAKPKAVLDGLNLARVVNDGEQILVPDRRAAQAGPTAGTAPAPTGGAAGTGTDNMVSLNQATAADLETLPGIGPVLAAKIVEHRDAIGGFTEVGQLRDVSGIGEKTFQSLAPLVGL